MRSYTSFVVSLARPTWQVSVSREEDLLYPTNANLAYRCVREVATRYVGPALRETNGDAFTGTECVCSDSTRGMMYRNENGLAADLVQVRGGFHCVMYVLGETIRT